MRPAPAISPSVAAHGLMWIMLAQKTTWASTSGHASGSAASSSSGGFRFASAASALQAVMLARASGDGSLGVQVVAGRARAKAIACSPEPDAISSTRARAGRWARSTARMGAALRATAGEARAPCGAAVWTESSVCTGSGYSRPAGSATGFGP